MLALRLLGRLALLTLFLISLFAISSEEPACADVLRWSRYNIPTDGLAGNWVLADGSDVQHPAQSADGTLFCYANPAGTTFRLFKSQDGGYTWAYSGRVEDIIVDIALVPGDPRFVYFATASKVYKSSDAGSSFQALAGSPGKAGSGNVKITALDVVSVNGSNAVVAVTRDSDASRFGGVYFLQEGPSSDWQDTGVGSFDICYVAFSPAYSADHQIIAAGTDEVDTFIFNRYGNSQWGQAVQNARIPGLACITADIGFPDDYDSNIAHGKYTQFIAINTGTGKGDVFSLKYPSGVSSPLVTDLNVGAAAGKNSLDITSLAVEGNADKAYLVSGAAASTSVYLSSDGGQHWTCGDRPPTGDNDTYVLLPPGFVSNGLIYAATSGQESAFSVSKDRGITWSQTGLIDTRISVIQDLALSPEYLQDGTLYLLTANQQNSLWTSLNRGDRWQRIFCSLSSRAERLSAILLSPQFKLNKKVLAAGSVAGKAVIWKSEDGGQNWSKTDSVDPLSGAQVKIDAWAIAPGDILFVAGFDGSDGLVYQTGASGLNYLDRGKAGKQSLNMLAVSPDYATDHCLLAGNTVGNVFYSVDNGLVFQSLPPDAAAPPFSGSAAVAFDREFRTTKTIYAAGGNANSGIQRFIVGQSYAWETLDPTLPVGARIGRVLPSGSGMLYAVNSQAVNTAGNSGGIERSIDLSSPGPVFQTLAGGLDSGTTLNKLWSSGTILWAAGINGNNVRLMTYTDTLTAPAGLLSPANNSTGLSARNVNIAWSPSSGATSYTWQVDNDTQFLNIPAGFQGETDATIIKLPNLVTETTYYWRVKASQPVNSPWSQISRFDTNVYSTPSPTASTTPAPTTITPTTPPVTTSAASTTPTPGASGTPGPKSTPSRTPAPTPLTAPRLTEPKFAGYGPVNPVFRWSLIVAANQYEIQISNDGDFAGMIATEVCVNNFFECQVSLAYNSRYYWKVRSVNANGVSPWSEVSFFNTEVGPVTASSSAPALPRAVSANTSTSPASGSSPYPQDSPSAKSVLAATRSSVLPSVSAVRTPSQASPTPLKSQSDQPRDWTFWILGGMLLISAGVVLKLVTVTRSQKHQVNPKNKP